MLPVILLVDDEEEILLFLERILRDNYTILKAENGQHALSLLELQTVQLVVSDVMMPVVDGFELCRIMKSNVEYAHIPMLLLTAKNRLQAKVEGLQLGADAYIEKPFSKDHLLAQIKSLLANRSMVRDYFATSPLVHIKNNAHTKSDERFLETLNAIILEHIEDAELDVEKLAGIMNMSRITLYRKIKSVSDVTPVELINLTRLKRAAALLAEGDFKMYEIADMVGFASQSSFARAFLKQFHMTPTEYMHLKNENKRKA
ncbi:MAG TPA: response regulator [Chitinophagaceae bacterium]|nr:response regulator [Chitinophagaceae bacterium]